MYSEDLRISESVSLTIHYTVFQAEVLAILVGAEMMDLLDKEIFISLTVGPLCQLSGKISSAFVTIIERAELVPLTLV